MIIETFIAESIESACPDVSVYPVFAPEYQKLPFVVYQRTNTVRDRHTMQQCLDPVASFSVMVYSKTYTDGRDISNKIRLAIDNFTGKYGTSDNNVQIAYCYLMEESDGDPVEFEGESKPAYTTDITYAIKYREEC